MKKIIVGYINPKLAGRTERIAVKTSVPTILCPSCMSHTELKPIKFRKLKYATQSYRNTEGYLCLQCGYPIKK